MSNKKTKFAAIKKWIEKRTETGEQSHALSTAIDSYESAKKEILELKDIMKTKLENKKAAYAAVEESYKNARAAAKQLKDAEKKIKKAEKSAKK